MKKIITTKRVLFILIAGVLIFAGIYIGLRLPIISGYAAKGMCSCIFVSERDSLSVVQNDLNFFPINKAKSKINREEKSVTTTIFGLAKRKAVYRRGLGCTLVNDYPFEKVKRKSISLPAFPYDPDTVAWPAGDLLPDKMPEGVNISVLNESVDQVFDLPGEEKFKKTTGVLIIYNDTLVAEKYTGDITENTPVLGWSMSKSITSAYIGMLVKEGKLDINQPAPVKEWAKDVRSKITIDNLLHMNSGLEWTEDYFNLSDVTKMLYKRGNMYAYAIKKKAVYPPDSVWFYSSGSSNILSGIIRNTFQDEKNYYQYIYDHLFYKIGMQSMTFETDASGNFVSSSYTHATLRDWARFGLLYLNDGVWLNERILPEGWVKYTVVPAAGSNNKYGAQFWLSNAEEFPDVPADMYFCDGFQGQRVFIIPSKKLVIVRTGFSSKSIDFNEFIASVIKALPV